MEQQRRAAERRGWTEMLAPIEEQIKQLTKKKEPRPAVAVAKDMKLVFAYKHIILNRHEARKKQLEDNRKEWQGEKKLHSEKRGG